MQKMSMATDQKSSIHHWLRQLFVSWPSSAGWWPQNRHSSRFSPWKIPAGAAGEGVPRSFLPATTHHPEVPMFQHFVLSSSSPKPSGLRLRERGCGAAHPRRGVSANRQIELCNPPPVAQRQPIEYLSISRWASQGGGIIFFSCMPYHFPSSQQQLNSCFLTI